LEADWVVADSAVVVEDLAVVVAVADSAAAELLEAGDEQVEKSA
jgi:hypothetical protein